VTQDKLYLQSGSVAQFVGQLSVEAFFVKTDKQAFKQRLPLFKAINPRDVLDG
jgi:hypothetical protein